MPPRRVYRRDGRREAMDYISTRGQAPVLGFDDTVLAGLARDGGLYVPASWPALSGEDLRALRDLDYAALAARIIAPFAAPAVSEDELLAIARKAMATRPEDRYPSCDELRQALWTNAERFAGQVERMSAKELEQIFVKEQYGNYRRNIEGVIEHSYYHLGQLSLIKKMIREAQ